MNDHIIDFPEHVYESARKEGVDLERLIQDAQNGEMIQQAVLSAIYASGMFGNEIDEETADWWRHRPYDESSLFIPIPIQTNDPQSSEDPTERFRRLKEFARSESASPALLSELGDCYHNGIGTERDEKIALDYYQRAMPRDDHAAYMVGKYCYDGVCSRPDFEQAYRIFFDLAKQDYAPALFMLGECYTYNKVEIYTYNKTELPLDRQRWVKQWAMALYWYHRAYTSEKGNSAALRGEAAANIGPDLSKVSYKFKTHRFQWMLCAARHGRAESQLEVAGRYFVKHDTFCRQDYEKAVYWYKRAAMNGMAEAKSMLMICYSEGKGVEIDPEEALRWAHEAAESGRADSMHYLGEYFLQKALTEDGSAAACKQKAAQWFDRAVDAFRQGPNSRSEYFLAGYSLEQCGTDCYRAVQIYMDLQDEEAALDRLDTAVDIWRKLASYANRHVMRSKNSFSDTQEKARKEADAIAKKLYKAALLYRQMHDPAAAHDCLNLSVLTYPQEYPSGFAEDIREEASESTHRPARSRTAAEDLLQKHSDAKTFFAEGRMELGAISLRNGIETMLKRLCAQHHLTSATTGGESVILSRIDLLAEHNVIKESDVRTFHRVRIVGNKGAHPEDNGPLSEAECSAALSDYSYLVGKYGLSRTKTSSEHFRSAIIHSDYYSPSRKHYGRWATLHTYNETHVIPEFVELEQKAKDNDVSAMLDLAVGYLPREINWCDDGLIGMPPYRYRGKNYSNPCAYDARYYSWVARAALFATYREYEFAFDYDETYMPTALFETLLFGFSYAVSQWQYKFYVSGVQEQKGTLVYTSQNDEAEALGNKLAFICECDEVYLIGRSLLLYLWESGMQSLSAIYSRKYTFNDICYLVLALQYSISLQKEREEVNIELLRRDPFYLKLGDTVSISDMERLAQTPTSQEIFASVHSLYLTIEQKKQEEAREERERQEYEAFKAKIKSFFRKK